MKNRFLLLSQVSHHTGIIKLIMITLVKKNGKLSVIDKVNLNCDVIDGSLVNGSRQPILFSFKLD